MATEIKGRLATGIGQGKHFTGLEWARAQFVERLGIDPYPGTINIIVGSPADLAAWRGVSETAGIRIDNPNDGPFDCDARCYLVSIAGRVRGAIVLPEVKGYPDDQIEIIATVGVRDALGMTDGDEVVLTVA